MGHSITAIVVKGHCQSEMVDKYDLQPKTLGFGLTLFYIDHYYTACWQALTQTEGYLDITHPKPLLIPDEWVILKIVQALTDKEEPDYALIFTDYFGGAGTQWAQVFKGHRVVDQTINSINAALKHLGVRPQNGQDEFDTVGLGCLRSNPDYLDKYVDMAEELNV